MTLRDGQIRIALWALCALAVTLRIGAIVGLRAWESPNAMEHAGIAAALLRGDGFWFVQFGYGELSSVQSPPYPMFLAGLFALFEVDSPGAYATAMAVNALLGGLGVCLTFLTARALGAGSNVGLLAAAGYAVWPTQIYATTTAQAITMITVALLAMIVLFHASVKSGRMTPWIGFSVVGCLAALTEPILLPAMLLTGMAFAIWPMHWSVSARLRHAIVLLAAGLLILGPWTLRNYVVHGALVPVKSTFWVNMWKGNNPHATGTDRLALTDEQRQTLRETPIWQRDRLARSPGFDELRQYDRLTSEQLERLEGKPEIEREAVFRELSVNWIRENPEHYLSLCGRRFLKTAWLEWDNPKSWNLVYMVSRTLLVLATIVGLAVAVLQGWRLGFVAMVAGSGVVLVTMTVTAARFALPYEPLQIILGAAAVVYAVGATRRGRPENAQEQVQKWDKVAT